MRHEHLGRVGAPPPTAAPLGRVGAPPPTVDGDGTPSLPFLAVALAFLLGCPAWGAERTHVRTIEGPVLVAEEGFLLGNGDLSVSTYQTADEIVFRFGKGDVWDRRMDFTGVPKPATLREYVDGVLKEGWKTDPFNGRRSVATKGAKDEKRMHKILGGGRTALSNGPYPCPKPTGELRMHYPSDLPGPVKISQRLAIEEGRLFMTLAWANGVRLAVDAVVAPDANVLSLGWSFENWNSTTFLGRDEWLATWFGLHRWADPDSVEWAARFHGLSRHSGVLCDASPKKHAQTLPPPESFKKGRDGCIEQRFYPDRLFPDGFRCRLTLHAGAKNMGEPWPLDLKPATDAWVHLMPSRTSMTNGNVRGEVAVTVTTSRDRTLDAPPPKTHAEYVAAAKESARAYWSRGRLSIPSDPFLEDLWFATWHARRCVLRGGTVPPGLFLPSTLNDYSHWNGDYHANYNMQAIYWGDFSANRLEQADAYCDMVDFFVPIGRKIARDYFGCRGVFIQLQGFPLAAEDDHFGKLPAGRMTYMTGWAMTRHWEYFRYTRDRDWLAKRGYPFIRDCALFYLDYLKKAPHPDLPDYLKDGKYHAFPSPCGENGIDDVKKLVDGWQVMIHARHCLWAAAEAAKTLGVDGELEAQWRERLQNLGGGFGPTGDAYRDFCTLSMTPEHTRWIAPYKRNDAAWDGVLAPISGNSRWYEGHNTIWKIGTPRSNGAVPAKIYAEFERNLKAWTHPNGLVWAMALMNYGRAGAWSETLSVMAPFQEMLLQSWDGAINVFPRWPADRDVRFENWRAQGAFIVSAEQKGGKTAWFEVRSEKGEDCLVHGDWTVVDSANNPVATDRDAFGRLRFKTVPQGRYLLVGVFPSLFTHHTP